MKWYHSEMHFEFVVDNTGIRESGTTFNDLQFRHIPMNMLILYSPGGNGTGVLKALEMEHPDTKNFLAKHTESFPFSTLTKKQNLHQVICAVALDHYLSGKDTLFSVRSLAEMTGYSATTVNENFSRIAYFCENISQMGLVTPAIEWAEVGKGLFRVQQKA